KGYNKCGLALVQSHVAGNILLRTEKKDGNNLLYWNSYNNWDAGLQEYQIYKGYDNGSGFTWNQIPSTTDTFYEDRALDIIAGNEGICYYIKANENTGNQYGLIGLSSSNMKCMIEEMELYIPNAAVAKKGEIIFQPKGLYIDYNLSKMSIF